MNAKRTLLLLTVFVGGMTSLGVELTASRLLDPFFGNSLIIWAVLIGMVLLYLTVGYYIGGKWADRKPYDRVLYQITAWAAFLIGLVPFVARPVLLWSVQGFAQYSAGILAGSLLGVVALFAVPITLLGCVSPFAIRLAGEGRGVGGQRGRRHLCPVHGGQPPGHLSAGAGPDPQHRHAQHLLSLFLRAAGRLAGGPVLDAQGPRPALPAHARRAGGPDRRSCPGGVIKPVEYGELLYETESAYNYIQVVQWGDEVWLKLNEGQGVHSIYDPNSVLVGGIWDFFLIAPFFNNPPYTADQVGSLALIGSAAGTVPKQYTAVYGAIPIDGAEIDPEIIRVGREYFRHERAEPERRGPGWPLLSGQQPQDLRRHRHRRLSPALHPLSPDHPRVLCPVHAIT